MTHLRIRSVKNAQSALRITELLGYHRDTFLTIKEYPLSVSVSKLRSEFYSYFRLKLTQLLSRPTRDAVGTTKPQYLMGILQARPNKVKSVFNASPSSPILEVGITGVDFFSLDVELAL